MAATKKPTGISKHKTTTTRRAAKPAPQAFDIIPPSRVRPSATSRPVIISTQPPVADNTLTPPTAPSLQLKHSNLTIKPSADFDPGNDTDAAKPAAVPAEKGVSVSELIAKQSGQQEPESAPEIPGADADARDTKLEAPKPEASVKSESPAQPETPAQPPVSETQPAATKADQEAAELLKTEPADDTAPPAAEDAEVAAATEAAKADVAAPPEEETKAEPASLKADTPDSTPGDAPADSLEHVLKEDETKPQEHSESLKEAIKDLDEKDGRPHHELYGGKPVIVIHKDHGTRSALVWMVWFIVCVGLAVLIVNFLLDAGIIETTYNVPHTDLIE